MDVLVPLVTVFVLAGSAFIPVSLALVLLLWDHQHSLMQQHRFARIFDFNAGTGTPGQRRLDLWLGLALYGNLLVTAPLWSELWIAELFRWDLGPSAGMVRAVQTASWSATAAFLAFYALLTGAGTLPLALFVIVDGLAGLPAFRVLMVQVYDRTESLFLAMLMHVSLTATVLTLTPRTTGVHLLAYGLAFAGATWLIIAAVKLVSGRPVPRKQVRRWAA